MISIKTKDKKYPPEFDERIPYLREYLKKYSSYYAAKVRNTLIHFSIFIENNYDIKDITICNTQHIIKYFEEINKRNILRESKSKYRNILKAYYEYIKEIKEKIERKSYINPVPSARLFDFDEKTIDIDYIEREAITDYETVEKVLNYLYFTNPTLFIIVSLLLYTGARISEIVGIKLKNIDITERFFFTKIKGKKQLNRHGVYFFPAFFIKYIKNHIEKIKAEYSNPEYLFPNNFGGHISTNTVRKKLRKIRDDLNISCNINPHSFRDFINTERFDKNLNKKYRCLLLNQTPKNVNVKNYLKKYRKRKELQKIYDATFPFPEFKPRFK
ncbi:MAG: tyrosine-type recombinase/integrase [Promethearchaeia archaeon]